MATPVSGRVGEYAAGSMNDGFCLFQARAEQGA
jgi:hypothetical protein